MSRMITAKIDVTKIIKSLLFKGKKGTYLDLTIWINEEKPDNYGNTVSIQQRTGKDDPKIYLGEGKFYEPKKQEPAKAEPETWHGKKEVGPMSDINELPQGAPFDENLSDLPF